MDRLGALRLEPQGARRAVPAARQGEKPRARDHRTKGRRMKETGLARYRPKNFQWRAEGRVGVITLDRPERKKPLTFQSYGELHDLIGPLTKMRKPQLLEFTAMTGDLVKAMRHCPQPVVAAVDGVCAGAGAIIALFSDLRYGTRNARVAFLFTRVGLAGCDMGACAMLPRVIGQGRAAELLYTGRAMSGEEGLAWGFFNALAEPGQMLKTALEAAQHLASGPTFAHGMTKKMLREEWAVGLDQAIEMEAKAQAICMQTRDFRRAYEAFAAKQKPVFEGD